MGSLLDCASSLHFTVGRIMDFEDPIRHCLVFRPDKFRVEMIQRRTILPADLIHANGCMRPLIELVIEVSKSYRYSELNGFSHEAPCTVLTPRTNNGTHGVYEMYFDVLLANLAKS